MLAHMGRKIFLSMLISFVATVAAKGFFMQHRAQASDVEEALCQGRELWLQ